MRRLRRIAAVAAVTLTALPAAASAAVTCPVQPPLNAWAGSPKTLTIAPCTGTNGPVAYTVVSVVPAIGTATAPAASGSFVFTGSFVQAGDPLGDVTLNLSAVDADAAPLPFSVPISINAAPELSTTFTGKDLQPDTTLAPPDNRPTFDVFYKTPVTTTATLTDPTPGTPLAAFTVRLHSELNTVKTAPTNAAGKAVIKFTPLVTEAYDFGVPALPGTFLNGYVFWVAPDWKVAKTFPVKHKKYVISGRLLASKSARTKGSSIAFQRLKGKKWITVIRKVPISTSLTFTVKVSRSAFSGKTVRFVYTSKTVDYIGSSFRFTIKPKVKAHVTSRTAAASFTAASRGLHR